MSRTDVHRPWDVQINDPYNRHRLYRFQAWGTREPILVPIYRLCGCATCTGWPTPREQRRRSRHQWKLERANLLKIKPPDH